MTPRADRATAARQRRGWRSERGEGALTLLLLAAAVAAAVAGWQANAKKVPAVQAALLVINPCLKIAKAATEGIIDKYAEQDESGQPRRDPQGNPIFPAGLQIPLDDPSVVALKKCQADVEKFNSSVQVGNHQALAELNGLIQQGLGQVGQCTLLPPMPSGVAGIKYGAGVQAQIAFNPGIGASGTIAVTGAAAGAGSFASTPVGGIWQGSVEVPAAASANAAGGTSQVTATATTAALVPPTADGRCPGAAIEDGGRCVQIAQGDGTCPAGQFLVGGRCYVSCTTAPIEIKWEAPKPAKIVGFSVSPTSIAKGSTDPVTLQWVIDNAESATLSPSAGPVGTDPKKRVIASLVLNPPPTETTTWSLLAIGVNGSSNDAKSATLVVRESAASTTVAIVSPRADEKILEEGVTVSGKVSPVPDEAHRKAQILVNGSFLSEATIDGSGNFSARTALLNQIALGDIDVVGNPSVFVNACGALSEPIGVSALTFGSSAKNLIRVVVPLAGGSASAQVQVEHVISVNRFAVQWAGGCGPAPGQESGLSLVVSANQDPVRVGRVFCGFRFVNGPVNCTDTAFITIGTSVGTKTVAQSWTANIPAGSPGCD